MRIALISLVLVVAGIGAIIGVAATSGPPDGYVRFTSGDVHVYRPTALTVVVSGGPAVMLNARAAAGAVRVVSGPARGRTLDVAAREAIDTAGGGRIASTAPVDVTGADAARKVVADDPERRVRRTAVAARNGDRLYVLTVSVRRGTPAPVLDAGTVVDSFYLE